MPVLEAMATGLPVVTTDCLGVRTFCRHGENCLIGLPDDVAGVYGRWHVPQHLPGRPAGLLVMCGMVQHTHPLLCTLPLA